ERHPAIDLLVNNAGLSARGSYLTAPPERIEEVVRINYLGSVWTTLAFLAGLGHGSHVANVVSVAGTFAMGPYSASKHAQLAFSRSLTVDLAPRGRIPAPLYPLVASPELVAGRLLRAIDRGQREVYVPRWYRPVAWLQPLFPSLLATARARTSRPSPRTE